MMYCVIEKLLSVILQLFSVTVQLFSVDLNCSIVLFDKRELLCCFSFVYFCMTEMLSVIT